jgi:hypothetical protein
VFVALFDRQLELVNEDDLQFLVENQEREGYQIEYKQAVPFENKQDKVDFLAAITSFANTVGGDLLIGVSAKSGVPVEVQGWQGVDLDKEKLRIENLLRDQVEPRISFKLREVRLRAGGTVMLVRVPWSWAQPHMIRMDQVNRFYYRHSAGKEIMNVSQLRGAFAFSTSLDQQIEDFRRRRISGIKARTDGYLSESPAPVIVAHLFPLESFRSGFQFSPETIMEQAKGCILPLGTGSNFHGYNLDGIYCVDDPHPSNAYTQVFRNGIIEGASQSFSSKNEIRLVIASGSLKDSLLYYVRSAIDLYRKLNIQPPLVVAVSLLGVRNCVLATAYQRGGYYTHAFDRDEVVLPATLVQDFNQSPLDICRPVLDALWNAVGLAKWSDQPSR